MKNAGYSLVEALVAIALTIGGSLFVKYQFLAALGLQDVIKDRNYLQGLEDDLRTSILDDKSFSFNLRNDPVLRSCIEADNINCPKTKPVIKLVSSRAKAVTGGFAGPTKTCEKEACPVQILVVMGRSCPVTDGEPIKEDCDVAAGMRFEYQIKVDGNVYRQGFIHKQIGVLNLSDDNSSCATDAENRTEFARVVSRGHVVCTRLERPTLKLRGLYAGACNVGLEVMSGFNIAGHPICTPIKWD